MALHTLRAGTFPAVASVVEFVYPKADAVAIATSNPAKVPAVDPASEGKVTDNTLSQGDMQLLTLWLLSLRTGRARERRRRYQSSALSDGQRESETGDQGAASYCELVAVGVAGWLLLSVCCGDVAL